MAKISALAAAAKKKAEEEAKKAAEEARKKAQAAAAAQRSNQQAQQKAGAVAQKAAQTVKAKAATASKTTTQANAAAGKKKYAVTGTTGTQGKASQSALKKATEAVKKQASSASRDGNDRSVSAKYVSNRKTSGWAKEVKDTIVTARRKAQEQEYSQSGTRFADDLAARQLTRNKITYYSRRKQQEDAEREGAVSRLYLRSGLVDPLALAEADGITGRTPAKTAPKLTAAQKAQAAAKRKQEENNYARYSKTPLSNADRKLPENDRLAIQRERRAWEKARDAGDLQGMTHAHTVAESIRRAHGYTGGKTGDEYYSPSLSARDKLNLNKKGETALKKAKLDYELAISTGQRNRASQRGQEIRNAKAYQSYTGKRNEREAERNAERRRILETGEGMTDAHGRPMPGDNGDAWRSYARISAAGYGVGGALAKAAEGVANAARNNERARNMDQWYRDAQEVEVYEARLREIDAAIDQYGYDPLGRNRNAVEKQLRAAQYARDQLERLSLDPNSDWFDATKAGMYGGSTLKNESLGDRWLRTSQEQRDLAVQGLGSAGTFLTDAAIAGYQMLPSVAAAMLPGVGPAAGAALMGGQAMGQKIYDVEQNGGYTSGETLLRGLGAGLIETATEAIPLHRLAKLANGGTGKRIISNILTQAGIEGAEEAAAYVGNYAADLAARDPNREFSLAGLTENALMGAALGGAFGTVGAIAGTPARGGSNVPENTRPQNTTPALPAADATAAASPLAEAAAQVTARQRLDQVLAERRAAQGEWTAAPVAAPPAQTRNAAVVGAVRDRATAAMRDTAKAVTGQRTMPGGNRRAAEQVEPSRARAMLEETSQRMGVSGRKALVSQYRDGDSLTDYKRAFSQVYDQAVNGTAADKIKRPAALDEAQHMAAAVAGAMDRTATMNLEREKARNARVNKEGGLRDFDAVRKLVGKKTARELDSVAKAFGRRVSYVSAEEMKNPAAQGEVNGTEVRINRDYEGGDAISFIVGHELTHSMQDIAPEEYRSFREFIMQDEANLSRVDAVLEAYERAGESLTREQAMDEITADAAGSLFRDTSLMEDFITRNKGNQNILVRMWQAIKNVAAKLTGRQKQQADEVMTLLENAMDETARRVKELPAESAARDGRTRHSFAGTNARTANVQRLSEAQEMEQNGTDNESIRQSTGWHKGRDGKWRFEIDDSQMEYFPDGDARFRQAHPEYVEYRELYQKLFDGTLTDAEQARLEALEDTWGSEIGRLSGRVMRDEATLEDILQHDALFEAYPELRDVRVEMRNMAAGVSGNYDRNKNTITLNSRDVRQTQESALIHEIQHAIQQIEGFANGTNPERAAQALAKARERKIEEINAVQKQLYDYLQEIGLDEFSSASLEKVYQGERSRKEHRALREQFIKESEYGEEIEAAQRKISVLREQLSRYGMSGIDAYKHTAGEIEARDTQERMKYNARVRRQLPPDLGGEDTVFAEGGGTSYLIREDENGEKYVDVDVDQHLFDGLTVSEMQTVAKKEILDRFRGKVIGSNYTAYVNKRSAEHYAYPANRRMDVQQKEDKMRASTELDHIIEASAFRENVPDDGRHPEATGGIDKLDTVFQVGGRRYSAEITVLVTDRGRVFYDLTKFKDITGREIGQTQNSAAETFSNAFANSISQDAQESNTKISMPVDESLDESNAKYSIKTPGVTGEEAGRDTVQNARRAATARRADEARQKRETIRKAQNQPHPEQWEASRVGEDSVTPKSLTEIVDKIRKDWGINITAGHIRGSGIRGQYNTRNKGIRSKSANDLPVVAHELGHHLDNLYGLTDNLSKAARDELTDGLDPNFAARYQQSELVSEGHAEFFRRFLQNRETAAIDYPVYSKHFLGKLSDVERSRVEQLADDVNAYYSLNADTATDTIKTLKESRREGGTLSERARQLYERYQLDWIDTNYGIKKFERATGANVYKLATNAAYSDAMAGRILETDLTDQSGAYIGPGLGASVSKVNLKDKKTYAEFGEYLKVRHGPERLKEGMRIFADDRKNSTQWMNRRQRELEAAHPEFAEAAENLDGFIRNFNRTWMVKTGLIDADTMNSWEERWPHYVPMNRVVGKTSVGGSARKGYANQSHGYKRAKGSGLDTVHPLDSLMVNVTRVVNAGVRNNVMRRITDAAERMDADALFLEKVPDLLRPNKTNISGVKSRIAKDAAAAGISGLDEILDGVDDVLLQFSRGIASGDVVTVMKKGKPEYWKINDPALLASVTQMSQQQSGGILSAYGRVSRFMTANITGNNILWSIFSNFPRDLATMWTFSRDKSPLKLLGGLGSSYAQAIKGRNADPLYKEFLAMGGGRTSAYTADDNLAQKTVKRVTGGKEQWLNPMEWLEWTSNLIELGPRYATYKIWREKGATPEEAFYEAEDITTNFRRGGRLSREVNKVVPFFNASVQGLDKFARWITAAEAPVGERKKVCAGRVTAYVAASAAIGAMFYALNNKDEEDRENYHLLSNFTKNSYFCIPAGDGEYFCIPKPREIAVLSSLFETAAEYAHGGNTHAFDGFYDYITSNMLPGVVDDLAKLDLYGALGSIGIVGVLSYMAANRDFLGRPIISGSLEYLEPKDQYNDRTSKIAKAVGDAMAALPTMTGSEFERDLRSPQMIDYFFGQVLGGFWKAQKALFPVGGENRDLTLGVQGQYIKDNQYSTDLTNWLYDKKEASERAHKSDPGDIEKAIAAKQDENMTTFYSRYNKLSKGLNSKSEAVRGTRKTVLAMIAEYQKQTDAGNTSPQEDYVNRICAAAGNTDALPAVMQQTVKDKNKKEYALSDVEYLAYQTDYNRLYWEMVGAIPQRAKPEDQVQVFQEIKSLAKKEATNNVLKKRGASVESDEKYKGIDEITVINFKAQMHQGMKQEEVIAVIKELPGLTKAQRSALFRSRYTSDKNNPWA